MTETYKTNSCICRSAYTNNIKWSSSSYSTTITMNKERQCKLIEVLKNNFGFVSYFQDYHNSEEDTLEINGTTIKLAYRERTLPGTDIRIQYLVLKGNKWAINEFITMIDSHVLGLFGFEKQLKEIKRLRRDSEYRRNSKYNDLKWEYKRSPRWKKNKIKSAIKDVMADYQKYAKYIDSLDELAEEQHLLYKNAQQANEDIWKPDECDYSFTPTGEYKWMSEYDYSSNFPNQDEFWKAWYYRKYQDLLLWFDLS